MTITQEQRDLLLKDLCGRLPYGVKIQTPADCWTSETVICELKEIFKGDDGLFRIGGVGALIEYSKPYLFPISSMTKEQIAELAELCDMYTPDDDYHPYAYMGIEVLYKHVLDDSYKFIKDIKTDVIDFFHKNHIDYLGLIPKGLAEDATGKNIY